MLSRFEKMTLLSSANDHLKALEGLNNRVEKLSLFAQLDTVLEQLTGDNASDDNDDTGSKTSFGFPSLPASEKLHTTFPPWAFNFKPQRLGAEPVYVNKRLGYAIILQLNPLSSATKVQEDDLKLVFSPETYKGYDGMLWPLEKTVEKLRTGQIVYSKDKASIRSAASTVLARLNKAFPMHISDSQISIYDSSYKVEYAGLKYPIEDIKNLTDAVAFALAKFDDSEVSLVKIMQFNAKSISRFGWDVPLAVSGDPLVAKKVIDGRQVSVTFDHKIGSTALKGQYSVVITADEETLYNSSIPYTIIGSEFNTFIKNMDTFVTELIAKQTIH